jgi:phosphate transport system permease protein
MTSVLPITEPPVTPGARTRRRPAGSLYAVVRWGGALIFGAIVVALVVSLVWQAAPAFRHSGFSFIFNGTWSPDQSQFGAGVFIIDTLITTGVALLIAIPVGIATAAALSEFLPRRVAAPLSTCIDLLAAIPSIVVGLWGLIVLIPIFDQHVGPFMAGIPLLGRLFGGPSLGTSIFLASVVLAIMVLPTMVALTRTAFQGVSVADREAAIALGGTGWQVVRRAVIPGARSGIQAAITLAMGRALGEAIAVSLVIGGGVTLPHSLLANGTTLGSAVVNFFSGSTGLQRSAVIGLVVVLLAFTALANIGGQYFLRQRAAKGPDVQPAEEDGGALRDDERSANVELLSAEAIARRRSVVRQASSDTLRRRRIIGDTAQGAGYLALLVALVPLVALVGYTISRGAKGLSWDLFTQLPVPEGVPGGGVANAIVGTLIIVGLAALMAVPVGLAVSLFLIERTGRLANGIRFVADVLSGIPSIAIGVFAYALIVVPSGHYSGISGSFALAVLMLPIIVRTDEVAMRTVPEDLWDAGLALGARPSRVVRSVVVRGALPGIVTGNLLAVARAVGETAPLLFTALGSQLMVTNPSQPMDAMPLSIFSNGTQFEPDLQTTAWATALVLLAFILILSIVARSIASYATRHAR